MRVEGSFFSVARTTPLVALMPSEMAPACTALSAYSICMSLPLGLKVVSEKEYCTRVWAVWRSALSGAWVTAGGGASMVDQDVMATVAVGSHVAESL